jgi:hypothetical protein
MPKLFIDSVINSKGRIRMNEEQKPLSSVYIPYVKGVSEKFKRIGNRYNIRTIFRTRHSLRSSLMKTRPERDPLQTAQRIPVNVAEATLAKQADLSPCGPVNRHNLQ